jgi:hypothetical protein
MITNMLHHFHASLRGVVEREQFLRVHPQISVDRTTLRIAPVHHSNDGICAATAPHFVYRACFAARDSSNMRSSAWNSSPRRRLKEVAVNQLQAGGMT